LKEGVAIILAQQYALVKHPQVGAMIACSNRRSNASRVEAELPNL